jgi:hypothetical protein
MPEIIIRITDEQHTQLMNHFEEQQRVNAIEETFSGGCITLNFIESGLSWLTAEMNHEIELGDVDWEIKK